MWIRSSYNILSSIGSMTLCEIALKNEHNLMIVSRTFTGTTPLIATGRSCIMITWQLWAFKQLMLNFKSFMFAILLIFDEYPIGTFSSWKNRKNLSFSFVSNDHDATGSFFLPSGSVYSCRKTSLSFPGWLGLWISIGIIRCVCFIHSQGRRLYMQRVTGQVI